MTIAERNKLYTRAITLFGSEKQILVAVEELAELQKELLKNINRGKNNRDRVIDEIADVMIMVEQLYIIYGIKHHEIDDHVETKLERLRLMIGGTE